MFRAVLLENAENGVSGGPVDGEVRVNVLLEHPVVRRDGGIDFEVATENAADVSCDSWEFK